MENHEKKHHHFIPQVYLRKFHHTKEIKGKKSFFFVSVYDKLEDTFKEKVNISEICAKKKLYTVDSHDIRIRESIENFYSASLENDYNKIYNLLVDSQINIITLEQRELIITTIVNLYLRNYFQLKKINDFWESLIKRYPDGFNEKVYDEHNNILFDFSSKNKSQVIDNEKKVTKQIFLKTHLEQTIKWTRFHFHDSIIVGDASKNKKLIASDNPVIVKNINESLYLPIDTEHFVTLISPPRNNEVNDFRIYRNFDLINTDYLNIFQFENSERFVIASDILTLQETISNYEILKKSNP